MRLHGSLNAHSRWHTGPNQVGTVSRVSEQAKHYYTRLSGSGEMLQLSLTKCRLQAGGSKTQMSRRYACNADVQADAGCQLHCLAGSLQLMQQRQQQPLGNAAAATTHALLSKRMLKLLLVCRILCTQGLQRLCQWHAELLDLTSSVDSGRGNGSKFRQQD